MVLVLRLLVAGHKPLLRGWDHYWSLIREHGADRATFTAYQIAQHCEPGMDAEVRDYVARLVAGGIAERVDGRVRLLKRPRPTPCFYRDGRPFRQAQARQQLWNVLRREVGGVTIKDLAIAASTDDVPVTPKAAAHYAYGLTRQGILVKSKAAGSVGVYFRLTGTGNTGPRPPVLMRSQLVYDPNSGGVIGDWVAEEDQP